MRAVCPYTKVVEPVRAALDTHCPGWQGVDVRASDAAYHRLLSALWAQGEDFVIVEHDIEVHSDVLSQFDACPEPWCVFRYALGRRPDGSSVYYDVGLGCVRFRARLLAEHPRPFAGLPGYHWAKVDADLQAALHPLHPHLHLPPVTHHKAGEVLR